MPIAGLIAAPEPLSEVASGAISTSDRRSVFIGKFWRCPGSRLGNKKVLVGCIDLSDMNVESPDTVAQRIQRALPYVPAKNVIFAPDCGMKYLPKEVAFGKLQSMAEAARLLRAEYATSSQGVPV